MYPKLFTIGGFSLPTYGVLIAFAFLVGLWVVGRQARKVGLQAERLTDLSIWVLIAGLVGAKVMLLVVDWRTYSSHPRELVSLLRSAGVFYGGLMAALPVAWWYARRHALPAWDTLDAMAPAVVIGQSIGRLGCLAAGCCYGKPTDVAWAVTFRNLDATRDVGTPIDLPLHPTQIYESLATLGLFLVLLWLLPRRRFRGQIAAAYLMLYAAARFGIEFYRGDAARGTLFGGALSTSQFIALLIFAGTLALLPYLARTQKIERRMPTTSSS